MKVHTTLLTAAGKEISSQYKINDLASIANQKLAGLLGSTHTAFFLINASENFYSELKAGDNEQVTDGAYPLERMPYRDSFLERDVALLQSAGTPLTIAAHDDLRKHTQFKNITGEQPVLAALLHSSNQVLGVWYATHIEQKKKNYSQAELEIFDALAGFVSIALQNILHFEGIHVQEAEKNVLFQITSQLLLVRKKEDIYNVLNNVLKPYFNFYDCGILLLNKKDSYIDYSQNESHLHFSSVNSFVHSQHFYQPGGMPLHNSVLGKIVGELEQRDEPLQFSYADDYRHFVDGELLAAMHKQGYQQALMGLLRTGNTTHGVLVFNYANPDITLQHYFPFFITIAEQVAIALRNLIIQEEICRERLEKSFLLSISNEISGIGDLETVIEWLQQKVKELLGADYAMITLTSRVKNKVFYVLGKGTEKWEKQGTGIFRRGIVDAGIPFRESFYEYVESLPDGTLYDIHEIPDTIQNKPVEFCEALGIRQSFPMNMIHAGETIGHICIHSKTTGKFTNLNIPLLRNMVNQITISLVNIVSKEEMVEKEKRKNLEINVNNAVLANEGFDDVLGDISASINQAVGCDICYIRVLTDSFDPTPFHFFCEKTDGKFTVRPVTEKVLETGTTPSQAGKNAEEFLTTMHAPTILSGAPLDELIPRYQYLQIFTKKIGIRSFLFLPLQLKYNCVAYLVLGSRSPFAYIESDLDLIVSIKAQLSLTLDNRLAFYQINHLKELLETENLYLQEELHNNYNFNEIIGTSPALRNVFNQAAQVAPTDSTVLLYGETGTGKELMARAIHNLSNRREKVMVRVNCACLPAQLIESELFGHERGAFTGAVEKRIGKFELANGGTLFLDEIGELPLELQAKLLRVIQEREFERLGGRTILKTDIRIIAATNKDLKIETEQKRFRGDLYYRLNVFPIVLPPLRERKEDIPLLAMHFAKKFALKMRKQITAIQNDALQEMLFYNWPGNVRELEHVIEHSVIRCKNSRLGLGKPLLAKVQEEANGNGEPKFKTLHETEREYIVAVLRYCKGKVRGPQGAAQLLDVNPNTLESKMIKLGIKKENVFT